MQPILSGRFQKFDLNAVDMAAARNVNAYFWAFLQNKIADYASAAVEFQYDPAADQKEMFAAILEHERIKAQVAVLEELMGELAPPVEQSTESPESE